MTNMPEDQEYKSSSSSTSEVTERLDRLEAAIKRILSLQRIDDFTANPSLLPSNWCTHSGTSNGCSTKSIGCEIRLPSPPPS
jgi:hypothetical protein